MTPIRERAPRGERSGISAVSISSCPGAESAAVVVPAAELDTLTCPALQRCVIEQLGFGACKVLVIDFTRVEFFGAAGLGVLVEVGHRAELYGVELRLVVNSRLVWRPLLLTGLAGEFAIYEDLAQALTG